MYVFQQSQRQLARFAWEQDVTQYVSEVPKTCDSIEKAGLFMERLQSFQFAHLSWALLYI